MSFITYTENIKIGCSFMVESTNMITNMKNLKIGCIPFNLESKIQEILEATYELVVEVENLLPKNILLKKEEEEEKKESIGLKPLRIQDKDINPSELLKKLVKQTFEYFENRNKQLSRLTLNEKMKEIENTKKEFDPVAIPGIDIPEIYSFYAQNFREHSEVIITQLYILIGMFPNV
jgi:hypothetical protein